MTESQFTRWLFKELGERTGTKVIAIVGGAMQVPGLPDRYVSHPRFQGFIEMKVKAPLTTAQRLMLRGLRRTGTAAFVVRASPDSGFCEVIAESKALGGEDGVYGSFVSRGPNWEWAMLDALAKAWKDWKHENLD
jgi:hypothetical protein